MLNWIFLVFVLGSAVAASLGGTMPKLGDAMTGGAKSAVEIAVSLVGQMALWLGAMRVLEEAGLMRGIARLLAPVMSRLFPDVPRDHPAMSAMILNLTANMMGVANAATPFGLKAMLELDRLNRHRGVATNAMALFLAINTSGVAVLPLGAIATRASMGASSPAAIFLPTLLATMSSTITAIIVAKLLERLRFFSVERALRSAPAVIAASDDDIRGLERAEELATERKPFSRALSALALVVVVVLFYGMSREIGALPAASTAMDLVRALSAGWVLPFTFLAIVLVGMSKRVDVYKAVVTGGKEGFNTAVMIIPFLVAILVAIGMFRSSGAMDALIRIVEPVTSAVGFPAEALPMAIVRPLSGNGALGVMVETMKAHGPDSYLSFLVAVMSGSTETTFYVLALYFGSVRVGASRHTVIACLAADVAGMTMATVLSRVFF